MWINVTPTHLSAGIHTGISCPISDYYKNAHRTVHIHFSTTNTINFLGKVVDQLDATQEELIQFSLLNMFRHQYAHHQEYNVVDHSIWFPALKIDIKPYGFKSFLVLDIICCSLLYCTPDDGHIDAETCWAKNTELTPSVLNLVGSLPYLFYDAQSHEHHIYKLILSSTTVFGLFKTPKPFLCPSIFFLSFCNPWNFLCAL
jgi:hypothetical protein